MKRATKATHILLIALNVPVVLITLYLFFYAFLGLWNPDVATRWWLITVLSLPFTIVVLGISRRLWTARALLASNLVASVPLILCSPILWWIGYGAWHQ